MNHSFNFFLFTRGARGGGVAGDIEVKFVVDKYSPASGQIKAFLTSSKSLLELSDSADLRFSAPMVVQINKIFSVQQGSHLWHTHKKKNLPLSRFTSFSRGTQVWLWENHKHNSPLAPLFISFLPFSHEWNSARVWSISLMFFPVAVLKCFPTPAADSPRFRSCFRQERGKKTCRCLRFTGLIHSKSWPHFGWSKHLLFWRDTCSRWPDELAAWNENVAALCSDNKCFIWVSSLLAHNPQPVVTALKPSVLLYVEIGRLCRSTGDFGEK